MNTLYLCGAGDPEGLRLAIALSRARERWDRILLLDDDPLQHGRSVLGVEIAGPLSLLEEVDPTSSEVANLVASTTIERQAALRRIQMYGSRMAPLVDPTVDTSRIEFGLRMAPLIDPSVDVSGVEFVDDITVHGHSVLGANASVDEACVVFAGAIIGHGSRLGRCCVVGPGAVINARVELGEGVYVGPNASIMPDLKVGPWATVRANSAVVQDVPAGATVMGVPAELLPAGNGTHPQGVPPHHPAKRKEPTSSDAFTQLRLAQEEYVRSRKRTGS